MINENFVILGVIIAFLGGLKYVFETIKGNTKPNKVTWFLWALAPLIAFAAELKQGVGIQSWMTFVVGFTPLLVFLASFINKQAYWKLTRFDLICGALALLGLLLWYVTRVSNIAILFSILADGLAAVPTIVKSYRYSETEDYFVYLASAISAGLTLLTITTWNFATFGFPIYILTICLILFTLIKFKIGKLLNKVVA